MVTGIFVKIIYYYKVAHSGEMIVKMSVLNSSKFTILIEQSMHQNLPLYIEVRVTKSDCICFYFLFPKIVELF